MIFAIDGGGTTFKTALVDETGRLSEIEAFPVNPALGVEGLRRPIGDILRRRQEECRRAGRSIRAVGVGCRGIVDAESRRLIDESGDLKFFAGHAFTELVEPGLPLAVENDAVAATLGENLYGVGRRARHFILLTLGTGIGGGIIVDGEIYKGHTGMAGHLGHFPVNPEGDPCGCGNWGCVEREFSSRAFEKRIEEANRSRPAGEPIGDVKSLFQLAERGDAQALAIVRRGVFYLARAISGFANALDPEVVVLSGGIAKAGDFLMRLLVDELRPILWLKDAATFVQISALGDQMGLYGAGAVGARLLARRR